MITASILIIGNEVLSGRTQDTNINYIARNLKIKGISLVEVRIIKDDEVAIINTVKQLSQQCDYLFTTGGIGPTHDDITSLTIAKCFGLAYEIHPKALEILKEYYGDEFNDNRKKMAYLPQGAHLIENPVSKAPGFIVHNVYCMAGMPKVMKAMFQHVLPKLKNGNPIFTVEIKTNLIEGIMARHLSDIQKNHSDVEIGSYPFYNQPPDIGVVLVVCGTDELHVNQAVESIVEMILIFKGDVISKTILNS
ncbi:MAG: competence/damage-inducible protein A [Candidatus Puniceispirillum sp.]|nr:competence/damage-inducible protein A [Candidatus Pelagibacter sp.]MBA4282934.1 competence/damage-inducible protein A [Candidatus Puniceispirillum sp.]